MLSSIPRACKPGRPPPAAGDLAGAVADVLFAALTGRVPELLSEAHRLRELDRLAAEANPESEGGES